MVLQMLTLFGALGMFLFGMNMMSTGLQKAAGKNLRAFLASMTSNPFKRIMTGLGVTAIIQSSSATTVMVVGFVSAGLAVGMATDEIAHFAEITRKGFGYANDAIHAKNTNDFENYISKVNKFEEITDRIELEIANFLHS